ncbi:MAG: glycosyltransferase [Bacteroidota bacterium]
MKVLMFGWEFPPHISGGLGTACHGLTSSLSRENVDILFVVPKLHGGESASRTHFLGASKVAIPQSRRRHTPKKSIQTLSPAQGLYHTTRTFEGGELTQIDIESALSPYQQMESWEYNEITRWNYQFGKHHEHFQAVRCESDQSNFQPGQTYNFSGSYGPHLMNEVDLYAAVATVIAKQNSFDVIHAHDWMTYPAGIAAKRVSGRPLVVHVHATEFDRCGEHGSRAVHAIEYEGMMAADRIVTVSEWTKKIAMARYCIPPEKIEVVHNGIQKKIPAPHAKIHGMGSRIVTFLGRITHQKGPLYFVEAAQKVLQKLPDVHFVVAGAGDQLPLMIERAARLKLSSHFHFTGFLRGHDVERIWAMSKVYVMPSVSEPFGIAPLEAIQAGVPVIISKQSGVAEVMPHALKVDFWNTSALAQAICSVLQYPGLSKTLRKNSRAEIKNVTWEKAAKQLTNLYHDLAFQ